MVDVPFKKIAELPPEAQRQIWRNFEEVSTALRSVSHPWYFLAAHDASADEKARADYIFDGSTDSAKMAAIFAAHPGGHYILSGGNFNLTTTLDCSHGKVAAMVGIAERGGNTWDNTTINFNDNGVGGALTACDAGGALIIVDALYLAFLDVQYNGALNVSAFLGDPNTNGGTVTADHVGLGNMLTVMGTTGGGNFAACQMFAEDVIAALSGAVGTRFSTENFPAGHRLVNFQSRTGSISLGQLTQCIVVNPIRCTWTELAGGTNYILDSRGAANSFRGNATGSTAQVLDISATSVPGLIGVDKNMLPSELGAPQSGITQFPPAAAGSSTPTGPAGGSLSGTYPNPTFAGRDSSVDALNKDLLPAALLDQGTPLPQVFPPASYILQDTIWVNVKDHGAKGDGVTDDTAAINAAITFANWPTNRAVIYFPPGTYLTSSTITLSGGGASSTPQIALVGWGATITTTSVITMFTITDTISSVTRIHFQGLVIKPNATAAIGVSLNNAEFVTFNDCEFLGSGATAISIVASSTNPYCGVYDCNFSNLASGIVFNGNADFFTISNCNFAEGLAGAGITGWVDVPVAGGSSNGVRITGCVFRGLAATQPVIQLKFAVNWTITGCAFFDSAQESIWLGVNGSCKNTAVTGCTFQKGLQNDITINGGRLNSITGCLFGSRGAGVAASTFTNIRIKNTFGGAAGANNVITGCTSEDTGTALIGFAQLDDGCVNCSFLGNFYNIKIVQGHAQPIIVDPTIVQFHKPDEIDGMLGQPLGVTQFPPAGGSSPTGGAGGSLAGTYPNPTFAGRDSSVDQLNKDMLPSELGAPQSGVTAFPPAGTAPSGAAGGSLAGTYPNPTFAGRDASVDAINKDLLPAGLLAVGGAQAPVPFPNNMAALTIKGNNTSGPAPAADLTAAQVLDILRTAPDFTGGFMLMGA